VVGRDVTTEAEPTQDADGSWLRPLPTRESRQTVRRPMPDARRPVAPTQHEAIGEEHVAVHPSILDVIVEQGVT
jgi:hypothetical protein